MHDRVITLLAVHPEELRGVLFPACTRPTLKPQVVLKVVQLRLDLLAVCMQVLLLLPP